MRGRLARATRTVVALLALLVAVALGGCSGGNDPMSAASGDSEGMSAGGSVDEDALSDSSTGSGADGSTTDGVGARRVALQPRAVISTGEAQLVSDDLAEVRSQIDRLLGRFGGYVSREEAHSDNNGRISSSTLQLRVPSQHFDTVMASFAELATVVDSGRKVDDVTTEVIDVASRIRTQEISLERLRTFLGRATQVADMIRLEAEIAEREADLASLRAQQEYLSDQTSLATITVRMSRPAEEVEEDDPLTEAGFLTGLRNGWDALADVTVVAATAVGALLPFLVVVGAVAVPLVAWVRVTRRRQRPVEPAPPSTS